MSWHNCKTKPIKADITILGNKTRLRYFRDYNNTTLNEKTNCLEYRTLEIKVSCLPLNMILLAFHISHSLNTKRHAGSEEHNQILSKIFTFQMHRSGSKHYATIAQHAS